MTISQNNNLTAEAISQEAQALEEFSGTQVTAGVQSNDSCGTQITQGVRSFNTIAQYVEEYLPNSEQALKIALSVATSGMRRNRVMLWLLLVGVPSSGKTDLIRLFKQSKATINIDNLTLNAFISGERPSKKEKVYDLLGQLNGKCLIIKDWTVIFSLDERMTKKIIGDMVGAYDKTLSKFSSRRGNIIYNAEFSHLGCITPATLNKHHNYLNMIGPRFLTYSMPELTEEEDEKSFDAIFEGKDRQGQEEFLTNLLSNYLDYLNEQDISKVKPLNKQVKDYLKIASRFMARARGIVIIQSSRFTNEEGQEINFYELLDMQIEKPWRAVQQLMTLAKYLAFVADKEEVGIEELEIIKDVVLSSMPADRAQAMRALKEDNMGLITAKGLADQIEKSIKTSRRLLDELVFLKVLSKESSLGQIAASYSIVEEFKNFICMDPGEFVSECK